MSLEISTFDYKNKRIQNKQSANGSSKNVVHYQNISHIKIQCNNANYAIKEGVLSFPHY